MATRMLRRGLPRVAGGEPWPPAGDVEDADAATEIAAPVEASADAASSPVRDTSQQPLHRSIARTPESVADADADADVDATRDADADADATQDAAASAPGSHAALRRGLPRTPGGEPWPAAATARSLRDTSEQPLHQSMARVPDSAAEASSESVRTTDEATTATTPTAEATGTGDALRRGLPRTPGGEPWPPAGIRATAAAVTPAVAGPATGSAANDVPESESAGTTAVAASAPASSSTAVAVATVDVSTPLPFQRTVFPGKNAYTRPAPAPEPTRIGPFTKGQWAGVVIVGGVGLLGAAAMAVLFVRWLLSLSGTQDFLQTYPGEYHLPEGAPVGFPGWLGWQHFFNVFLMVLIIRSGLSVRNDKRPTAFWTARGNRKSKISLTLWFHQSLDILWLVNGIIFVVLLFVTGQWMRVIPTSWEVFPNALSAALQYVSLDWPTENGWVNYNSLQQLAYGATIFIAAPLAAITGVRMSGIWPKNATALNKAYPVEWARALHFPVMLYFVVFIAIHVILVFATGALRNLNHMYAAQGSTDPNAYADNWTGFWFLVASLVVIAAAWVAARPMVLAPIAKLFGNVSAR